MRLKMTQGWREGNAGFCAIVQKPLIDLSHHGYFRKLYPKTLLCVSAIMDSGINECLTLIGFDFGFSGGPVGKIITILSLKLRRWTTS
jgi:hypothetical protein